MAVSAIEQVCALVVVHSEGETGLQTSSAPHSQTGVRMQNSCKTASLQLALLCQPQKGSSIPREQGRGLAGPALSLLPLLLFRTRTPLSLAVCCLAAFMGLQAFCYAGFHAYVQVTLHSVLRFPLLRPAIYASPPSALSDVPHVMLPLQAT